MFQLKLSCESSKLPRERAQLCFRLASIVFSQLSWECSLETFYSQFEEKWSAWRNRNTYVNKCYHHVFDRNLICKLQLKILRRMKIWIKNIDKLFYLERIRVSSASLIVKWVHSRMLSYSEIFHKMNPLLLSHRKPLTPFTEFLTKRYI